MQDEMRRNCSRQSTFFELCTSPTAGSSADVAIQHPWQGGIHTAYSSRKTDKSVVGSPHTDTCILRWYLTAHTTDANGQGSKTFSTSKLLLMHCCNTPYEGNEYGREYTQAHYTRRELRSISNAVRYHHRMPLP